MAFIQAHIFSSTLGRGASVNVIKPQKGQPKKLCITPGSSFAA